ncbi:MAG: hypothetical protein ABSB42_04495 [Tepidisphaeraceae bacterium]|jgi:hypothetical protein
MAKKTESIDQIRREAESPAALLLSLGVAAESGDLARAAQAAKVLREKHGIDVKLPLSRRVLSMTHTEGGNVPSNSAPLLPEPNED